MTKGKRIAFDYRDVSPFFKLLRDILLGRRHTLHGRFPPGIAPRTIPPPDIPRGPVYKYSNQYYYKRTVYDSVKPPVVAPVAAGRDGPGGYKADCVRFPCGPPTPGQPWWWDGHCYFECVSDEPVGPPCPQPQYPPPPAPNVFTCGAVPATSLTTGGDPKLPTPDPKLPSPRATLPGSKIK